MHYLCNKSYENLDIFKETSPSLFFTHCSLHNRIKKNERDMNDLVEAPCSRTELNDLKKVGTCPTHSENDKYSSYFIECVVCTI